MLANYPIDFGFPEIFEQKQSILLMTSERDS